jgi:uncharacterized protein YbaR (Trm112 family)
MKRRLLDIKTRKEYINGSDQKNEELTIEEGILFCSKCSRFYPIIDEIPIMLPDELRDRDKDMIFLKKWRDKIPNKVIIDPRPYQI